MYPAGVGTVSADGNVLPFMVILSACQHLESWLVESLDGNTLLAVWIIEAGHQGNQAAAQRESCSEQAAEKTTWAHS